MGLSIYRVVVFVWVIVFGWCCICRVVVFNGSLYSWFTVLKPLYPVLAMCYTLMYAEETYEKYCLSVDF